MNTYLNKMQKMNTILRIYSFVLLILLMSCHREDSDVTTPIDIITEETDTFFDSHFIGKIVNEEGKSLEDVRVTIGNDTYLSSENGIFIFSDVKTHGAGQLVHVRKTGYFDQYIFIITANGQYNNLAVVLKKKTDFSTISGASNSEVSIHPDMQLSVPPNAFARLSGEIYTGSVRLYTDFEGVKGKLPVRDKNLSPGIFTESTSFRLEVETSDGLPLKIVAPLRLKTNKSGVNIAKLDISKDKLMTVSTENQGTFISATVDQDLPYQIGKFRPITRINTQIVNASDVGVSFTEVEIKDGQNETWSVQPGQDGSVSFYAPSNSSVTMMIKDVCGQVLGVKSVEVGNGPVQSIADVVLDDSTLTAIQSNIAPCGQPLSQHDLINLVLTGANKSVVAYQSEDKQFFVLPDCLKLKKATYFRGKQEKYSVSYSGLSAHPLLTISAVPLCIEKVSGYFSVNDVPILLNLNQYYIYREVQANQTLVISDLSGFMISIAGVTTKGKYTPEAVYFNHPSMTDCQLEQCSELTTYIDEISLPGEVVKIRIEGRINGNRIKGEFVNVLQN